LDGRGYHDIIFNPEMISILYPFFMLKHQRVA